MVITLQGFLPKVATDNLVLELHTGTVEQRGSWLCMTVVLICGHSQSWHGYLVQTDHVHQYRRSQLCREAASPALKGQLWIYWNYSEETTFLLPQTFWWLRLSSHFKNQDVNIKKLKGSKSVLFFNCMLSAGKQVKRQTSCPSEYSENK